MNNDNNKTTELHINDARQKLAQYSAEVNERNKEPVGFGGAVSAIAQGAMNEFADRTVLGRIVARPFIDTPGEQRERLENSVLIANQSSNLDKLADQQRLRQEQSWNRDITAHNTAINTHLLGILDKNPRYMAMTDKQKLAIKNNPAVQKFLNTNTLFRMGIDVFRNGKDRGAMDYYAKKLGIKITEKDGKHYIQFPEGEAKEINHTNFVDLSNKVNKTGAQEIATLVALEEQKHNLPGMARGQKVYQIARHFGNSVTQADNYHKAFIAKFDGIEQRRHYAVVGMDKIFEDGKVDPQEKQELMAQLGFLAERMGIKYAQDAEGNIFIKNEDGTQTPIQQFHKEFKAQDKIGIEWKKRVQELNLVTMQKAQLETAKRKAKLAELGYGEKKVVKNQLDITEMLNTNYLSNSQKSEYENILSDIAEKRALGWPASRLKAKWDQAISNSDIPTKEVIFPYIKEYYPKLIQRKRMELKTLAQESNKAAKGYSDYKDKYNKRPFAIMDPKHPDYASSSGLKSKRKNWEKSTQKRNKLSKEIEKLEKELERAKRGK